MDSVPSSPLGTATAVCRVLTTVTPRTAEVWVKISTQRHAPSSFGHGAPQHFHKYVSMHHFPVKASFSCGVILALFNDLAAAAGLTKFKTTWSHLTSLHVAVCQSWQVISFSWCFCSTSLLLEMKCAFRMIGYRELLSQPLSLCGWTAFLGPAYSEVILCALWYSRHIQSIHAE